MRRALLPLLLLTGFYAAPAAAQTLPCAPPRRVEWPTVNPVWKFCWLPPNESNGPDGSGLEIQFAHYKGKFAIYRLNVPVLNVLYDPGSGFCGPTYRDWLDELQAFQANNVVSPGYAEPTTTPKTVCDAPGADVGSFAGVAVQKLADRVVLTTQTQAGWYRYIQRITLWKDGTVEPAFGFTAVGHPCINKAHTHFGYWRFDLDIDGAGNDQIQERKKVLFFPTWSLVSSEAKRLRTADNFRRWRVRDKTTGRGYEIRPGTLDKVGGDPFGGSDAWLLQYHGNESDDGGATAGANGNAQHIDPFVNGESVDGQDVVAWYRISHRHVSGPSCTFVGPKLVPVGSW